MAKYLKKDKINYLKGTKIFLDNTLTNDNDNINNDNISINNNINKTLSNISNQLKNIAIGDKSAEFKLLNSSFRTNNKNPRNNIISNNNIINSSLNIENNQSQNKSNLFDITDNLDMNQNYQGLQKVKSISFYILKSKSRDLDENLNYSEIKKENLELKENVKFLLKQIKKYQKSGLTIEDMDINRKQELENLEKQINQLKQDINKYKNKMLLLDKSNKELSKENKNLKNFIHTNMNKAKEIQEKENQNKLNNLNLNINNFNRNKNIINQALTNETKKRQDSDTFYDIGGFDEKFDMNTFYRPRKNFIEYDINSSSKLSQELFAEMNDNWTSDKNKIGNIFHVKRYSRHENNFRKPRANLSEGRLYCRKNIRKSFLNYNNEPYSTQKKSSNNNFTYSKSYLKKNNISFKY